MEEIKTKRCSKCNRVLPITEFNKSKSSKDGLQCYCKECQKAMYQANKDSIRKQQAEYRQANKDAIRKQQAEYRQANKDAIAQKKADYYQSNKDAILQKAAEYRANNKEAIAQKQAIYNATHKEEIKSYHANYYQSNKDAILQKNADYYQENKDKKKAYMKAYTDPILSPLGWAKNMVNGYRKMDRDRGFDDSKTITAEWFVQNIMYKPCAHCGLRQVGAIGVNRLKNTEGHIPSNCEPCCRNCNSRLGAIYQLERGIHISQLRKKQSFKDFVKEHKKD